MSNPDELRVVLIGKTKDLADSAMDTMKRHPTEPMPKMISTGFYQGSKDKEEGLSEIVTSIFKSDSHCGPHVFLYVHMWEYNFNSDDENQLEFFKDMFGSDSVWYFLPLIRGVKKELSEADKKKTVTFFKNNGFELEKFGLIGKDDDKAKEQVAELVKEIIEMAKKNMVENRVCYTVDMFKKAQEAFLKKNQGNTGDDAKESSLSSAARELLTKVLGPDIAKLFLKSNHSLAKKLAAWIG